jgi:CRP/FNR family transcriptional regulator, cyclic AMP receptor protein
LATHSLIGIPFFEGMLPERRAALEARCRWRTCAAGTTIIGYLDATDEVFFLTSGKGRVIIYSDVGRIVAFRDIDVGDIFGELSAIDDRARSASIEAVDPCVVACLSKDLFWSTLEVEPTFMVRVVKHLAKQTRELTARIYEYSTLAVRSRIQAEILRLAQGHVDDSGIAHIRPIPQHGQIASRISTTREAVARELNHLARIGILRRSSDELAVLDLHRLEQMIQGPTGT